MPEIGDIAGGSKINKPWKGKYIYHACISCGKERWVRLEHGIPSHLKCHAFCVGKELDYRLCGEPKLGEIRKGREIGKIAKSEQSAKFIWHACIGCGKMRWVSFIKDNPVKIRCKSCGLGSDLVRDKCGNWKNRRADGTGYIEIKLDSNNHFFSMANKYGYVFEHRYIMAKKLGRCLQKWERVHHKDGIKDHNTDNNLELTDLADHVRIHSKGYRDGYKRGLLDGHNKQIEELRREIKLLQWQIKELQIIKT